MTLSGIQRGKRTRVEIQPETLYGLAGHLWRAFVDGSEVMGGFTAGARGEALFDAQAIVRDHIERLTPAAVAQ